MEQEWMRLLPIVVSAAQAAGDLIMTYYRSAYDSWDKSPGNPVTTADLAANRLVRQWLLDAAPGAGWLSEETEDSPERSISLNPPGLTASSTRRGSSTTPIWRPSRHGS